MARIENMYWDFGDARSPRTGKKFGISSEKILNVGVPVGAGMMNKLPDVMVVQALLNLAAKGTVGEYLLSDAKTLPQVSGIFDGSTQAAIKSLQSNWSMFQLRI